MRRRRYAREPVEQGLAGASIGALLRLRAQGVTPDYARELREAGTKQLSALELEPTGWKHEAASGPAVQLTLKRRSESGRSGQRASVDRLVELRIHSIDE